MRKGNVEGAGCKAYARKGINFISGANGEHIEVHVMILWWVFFNGTGAAHMLNYSFDHSGFFFSANAVIPVNVSRIIADYPFGQRRA